MPTLARNALTTLAAAKCMLGLEGDSSQDGTLTLLINQASGQIERAMSRRLRRQDYVEDVTPSGSQRLLVRNWPIVAVESVTQDGELIDPALYSYDPDGPGILYKDDGWRWSGYPHGLAYDPVMTRRNVVVRYTAGYVLPMDATGDDPATLPADIEGLALEMVQAAYGRITSGGNAGLKSFAISDVRWEWMNELPQSWRQIIDAYRWCGCA